MRRLLALVFALISTAAFAQVKQSGNVTPNTVPWWVTSGVIGGGVTSADSPVTSFGVTNNGLNGICAASQRITAAGRQVLCMGATDSGGGYISLQNYGTDTVKPFQFVINGTTITPAGGITAMTVGSTTIAGGSNGCVLSDVMGVLGCGNGPIYASNYGVKCDGTTLTDAANTQLALNAAIALGGVPVIMPAGSCPWTQKVFYNSWTIPGVLTVPGIKITGQGREVTQIDARTANDYQIAVNPDWKAGHQSLYSLAPGTSGSLASNTYFVQMTMNDGLGNEIRIGTAKSASVTGPSGSMSIVLAPTDTGYTYNLYCGLTSTPGNYCNVASGNAAGLSGNQTVVITALGSTQAFPTNKVAVWQEASISNLSFIRTQNVANASDLLFFRVGYSNIDNVLFYNATGNGLDIPNWTGDVDGSFVVTVNNSKFDTITGWCINAFGNTLGFSNFTVQNTTFNICGTPTAGIGNSIVITAINNSSAATVTTASPHALTVNDQVYISGVTGMTLANGFYRACTPVASNTFILCDTAGNEINTTSLGSYTASSGSEYLAWRAPQYNLTAGTISGSGAIAYVGLISNWANLDFTQNYVTNFYFSEAGTSDNATFWGIDMENTFGVGAYFAALDGGAWNQGECLSANTIGNTVGCIQLGTGFAAGGVKNFVMGWAGAFKVRNTNSPTVAFAQLPNTGIGATYQDSVRIGTKIDWANFDATGQVRFNGFIFDPIPGQVQFSISAQNTAKLVPAGYGGALPIHLKSPGEWVAYHVPTAGVTGAITGSLSATTQYNCFTQNSATAAFPIALAFACNSHSTALNEGYTVDSTDSTWTFIGTAVTDGGGNFQTSGVQTSWYPPRNSATPTTTLTGTLQAAQEPAHTGDMTNSAGSLATTVLKTNGVAFTAGATAAAGQLPGTATNDNASSGNVGEFIQSFARGGSATVTFTNASPTVVTHTGHGMTAAVNNCSAVNYTNSGGALPTGITAGTAGPPGTTYFVSVIDANTYHIASSIANCLAGTFVNTSSTGTGTQTAGYISGNLSSATATDIGGISLTAGDWDVSSTVLYNFASTTVLQNLAATVANTSNTLPAVSQLSSFNLGTTSTIVPNGTFTLSSPSVRTSIASTTTVFCDGYSTFGTSTAAASCNMRARRTR